MRLALVALLLTACAMDRGGPGVVGSEADMTTPAGDYVGYRVVTACEGTWTDVGVIGTGTVALTEVADISVAGQALHAELADLASVWGWGGYGLACEPGVGTNVWLSDWRDVDTVIARAGAWLATHDYALQVGIAVDGIPMPHATN